MKSLTWPFVGALALLMVLGCKKSDSTQVTTRTQAEGPTAGPIAKPDATEACADPKMQAEVEQRKKDAELKAQCANDVLAPLGELRALLATALETGTTADLLGKAASLLQRIDETRAKVSFPPVGTFLSGALHDVLRFGVTCQAAATATPQACDALLPVDRSRAMNCRREAVFLRLITRDMIAARTCDPPLAERAAAGLNGEVSPAAVLGFCTAVVKRDPEACKASKDHELIYQTCKAAAAGKTLGCEQPDPRLRAQCQREAARFAAASAGLVTPPEGPPLEENDRALLAATEGPGNVLTCRSRSLAMYDQLMEPARKFQNP